MTIPARYSGICPECGEPWKPGDPIRQAWPQRAWTHEVCPDPAPAVRPGEVACPACWLVHPEGECDR